MGAAAGRMVRRRGARRARGERSGDNRGTGGRSGRPRRDLSPCRGGRGQFAAGRAGVAGRCRALCLRDPAAAAGRRDAARGGAAVRDARTRRGAGAAVVAVGAGRGAAADGIQAWHRAAGERGTALADQLGRAAPDDRAEPEGGRGDRRGRGDHRARTGARRAARLGETARCARRLCGLLVQSVRVDAGAREPPASRGSGRRCGADGRYRRPRLCDAAGRCGAARQQGGAAGGAWRGARQEQPQAADHPRARRRSEARAARAAAGCWEVSCCSPG